MATCLNLIIQLAVTRGQSLTTLTMILQTSVCKFIYFRQNFKLPTTYCISISEHFILTFQIHSISSIFMTLWWLVIGSSYCNGIMYYTGFEPACSQVTSVTGEIPSQTIIIIITQAYHLHVGFHTTHWSGFVTCLNLDVIRCRSCDCLWKYTAISRNIQMHKLHFYKFQLHPLRQYLCQWWTPRLHTH